MNVANIEGRTNDGPSDEELLDRDVPVPQPGAVMVTADQLNGAWMATVAADKAALARAEGYVNELLQTLRTKDRQIALLRAKLAKQGKAGG